MPSLTSSFVRRAPPGKHYDRGHHGLLLLVRPSGAKHWLQRLMVHGRRRELGLGSYPRVSLGSARQKALSNKAAAIDGTGPALGRVASSAPTFRDASEIVIAIHKPGWKHQGKSEGQWRASFRDYAFPRIGNKRVDAISTADVMAVVLPIWDTKRETARRVRHRVGAVMKWAIAEGYREDNPAGDAVGAALPRTTPIKHHQRALPYSEVGAAIRCVQQSEAWIATKWAFEFLVLTAARSGEVRLADWSEVDFDSATWTIPAERMKAKRQHRVPLSDRALALLRDVQGAGLDTARIFPSPKGRRALSDATLSKLLRELKIAAVPHGFRSSFRDWCGETGAAPREVAEAALGHVIRNQAEAAYARSDLLERRRDLMESWSRYVTGAPAGE